MLVILKVISLLCINVKGDSGGVVYALNKNQFFRILKAMWLENNQ